MSKKNEDKQIPLRLSEYLKYIDEYDFIKDIDDKLGDKSLFSYQLKAVQNAVMVLKYYQDSGEVEYFHRIYNGYDLLAMKDSNKASFWMATGSGKTIVMVKLVKELFKAIKNSFIYDKPILILAPNEIILKQIEKELRANDLEAKILNSDDLKARSLFGNDVFLYRSDLLDDGENISKNKDGKRIDYHDYLQNNGWYIFLDEAHRGDSTDSKRKSYIKELSDGLGDKKGFIFNFSATFTDDVDMLTCAYNYNLNKFNSSGYGKEIVLFDDELKIDEDSEEELRIEQVLKSFLVFCLVKKSKELIKDKTLTYHNPLIIVVSDKVNTDDAGIKIYFKAVKKILENSFDLKVLKNNLKSELQKLKPEFSNDNLNSIFIDLLNEINETDMKKYIFHDNLANSLEACKINKNQREIVVKSKNSSKPFLLVNIGDNKEWANFIDGLGISIGQELSNGYFDNINDENSPINIMLGSKVFSEGWDSNRVNEILFLNIGSKNAIKYVTQTIGRGVRIEPKKGDKKRKGNAGIETLFVMASDSNGARQILKGFKVMQNDTKALVGFKKTNAYKEPKIPVYSNLDTRVRLKLSNSDLNNLHKYMNDFDDDVLYFYDNLCDKLGVKIIDEIKDENKNELFERGVSVNYFQNDKVSLKKIYQTIKSKAKKLEGFKVIDDEIKHFNEFSTTLSEESVKNINAKIKEVLKSVSKKAYSDDELKEKFNKGEIDLDELMELKNTKIPNELASKDDYIISAKLQSHYYLPLIIKENDDMINHSINNVSEVEFLKDLEKHFASCEVLKNSEWGFSRIVENVDDIYIPYFDTQGQIYRKFYPDFIFWLRDKASGIESIYFIDPKGLTHEQNPKDKIKGFEGIFIKNGATHNDIKVYLYYYNNKNTLTNYEDYVKGSIVDIFSF
ncbi:TPA: DEAD/DEAH box helicase family protein [Campylobacter jejuni]|uniref:DEAD/DEAH box helicase family protein n=1 Tax=Campylobacter jejuni TaxID=197 RepID=UPI00069A316E|nr:DEAD/DEAH box helicase family protein [Campylobacter jejuni]EAI0535334.1 DEAD/DEAH box helicase [Campylobacter jejuni]ECL3347062.1 DEAD/DEAH box helicase [Campylobacter jejuni]ECQ1231780.1 DEAD/DEAH box helicase [Campylobacter jejuni]HEF4881512.1 DEAD/DEAH box helicase family protein [Campylobacter jejuni]HEF4897732.1 DEAD/DEAH box helicase family protein [Campylobacter jejuni]